MGKWSFIVYKIQAQSEDLVPRLISIPECRFLFIIIGKEGHGKV